MYKSRFENEYIDDLYASILKLDTIEECYRFFEDVCTVKEIMEMALRLRVAKMLQEGKPYHEIVEETKASTATISRVNKSLMYGAEGYHLLFKKLNQKK